MYTLTGLAHTRDSKLADSAEVNQSGMEYRSRKLAALQQTLKTPEVNGEPEGDLLILGWGSTKGAIDEALESVQNDGHKISALHLRFLQPMAPGVGDIMRRFKRVVTVEINYSDEVDGDIITEENRRFSNLAWLLRARYLVDVQSFSQVHGAPLKPGDIEAAMRKHLSELEG